MLLFSAKEDARDGLGRCSELEKAVELHPIETEDQLLNLRSLLGSFSYTLRGTSQRIAGV
jgi:hypothetical protein